MSGFARRRFRVTGVVQGVGFRPFVFVTATSLELSGQVGNDSAGVFIEVEGSPADLDMFASRLASDAPPLSRIDSIVVEDLPVLDSLGFEIVASLARAGSVTLVSADVAPCDACVAELTDPSDRRYGYPFLNCTNCGPRFTITKEIPYDRARTTMADFVMCEPCRHEYEDPTNRRFHAQPSACAECGPRLNLYPDHAADPVTAVRQAVVAGDIVAIKGVGGFHLACRADSDHALAKLRERKGRVDKPFAVMVADLDTARQLATMSYAEERLLAGPERPIVLCVKRADSPLSGLVAPGNGLIGVMLPSSPLHHLLLEPGDVWVMTSGNQSQEPICITNEEALDRLSEIADLFLLNDRPIHVACDDSVVRVRGHTLLPLRRSRGYAPYPVPIRFGGPSVLAAGGELKATLCLTHDGHALMSQHVGDMANLETLEAFERAVHHMTTMFATEPEVLACDAHPRYLSSVWARRVANGRTVIEVQHHHAHLASLMAEHGISGPIIGFSFDGTGYGTDGTIWGGEVMVADLSEFERVGHLRPSALAGGDAAVRRPARQALARMKEAGVGWLPGLAPVDGSDESELRILDKQLTRNINTVATSSMGRLFDAVAALCGVRLDVTYEGQAAIELEALVEDESAGYLIPIENGIWDTNPLIKAVASDVRAGLAQGEIAARFHTAAADAVLAAALVARSDHGINTVGLSGGVFQNVVLTDWCERRLLAHGFEVLVHRLVPPNDGGLALGQAAVAAMRTLGSTRGSTTSRAQGSK